MLDGSNIRAVREAKGMTQAELAEKIGTSQQTVDKIERGVMKRTTYLPEIQQVLGIGDKAHGASDMTANRSAVEYIQGELARTGAAKGELAKAMQIEASALSKILKGQRQVSLSDLTLAQKFFGADAAAAPDPEPIAGLNPLMVLRTILCANPTAEQIMAALEANGFKIVPVAEESAPTDLAVEDTIAFVKEIMERRKVTSTELAKAAGLAASTLNRWLRNDGSESLTVRTLQKIREWDRAASQKIVEKDRS